MCFVLSILQKLQSVGTVELAVLLTLDVTKKKKKSIRQKMLLGRNDGGYGYKLQ